MEAWKLLQTHAVGALCLLNPSRYTVCGHLTLASQSSSHPTRLPSRPLPRSVIAARAKRRHVWPNEPAPLPALLSPSLQPGPPLQPGGLCRRPAHTAGRHARLRAGAAEGSADLLGQLPCIASLLAHLPLDLPDPAPLEAAARLCGPPCACNSIPNPSSAAACHPQLASIHNQPSASTCLLAYFSPPSYRNLHVDL